MTGRWGGMRERERKRERQRERDREKDRERKLRVVVKIEKGGKDRQHKGIERWSDGKIEKDISRNREKLCYWNRQDKVSTFTQTQPAITRITSRRSRKMSFPI